MNFKYGGRVERREGASLACCTLVLVAEGISFARLAEKK